MNDIVINKIQNIQRCVRRAREEYQAVVHQYTKVDIRIVEGVIASDLDEVLAFTDKVREYIDATPS